jgi:excisionase family DNA binding protein
MNAGEHILSGIVGVGTSFTSGVLSGVDNLIALAGAAGELIAAQKGTKIDTFVESLASNKYRPFADDIQEIVNFESNYTSMRDIDGNYSNYGKYIGGVATSLGEMLPSMIIGKGVGKVFSSAGASAKVAGTAGSIAAQGSFYAGMSAGNVQDTFLQYQQNGADIDSALILANSAIKSTLQWAVEYGYIETLRDIIETMDDARGDIDYYTSHPDETPADGEIEALQADIDGGQAELTELHNEYAADQRNRPVQSFKEAIPALQAYLLERDTAVSDHDGELFTRHFYTVPQAAALLQVHENTVYRWTRSRSITFYKIGQQIRIPADELKRMKEERLN